MALTDTALLLRVHAEHQWLQDELEAVLDDLERGPSMRTEDVEAALAYLEAMWGEELRRAQQTDAAFHRLERHNVMPAALSPVGRQAQVYYRWLRAFRRTMAHRVQRYVALPEPS